MKKLFLLITFTLLCLFLYTDEMDNPKPNLPDESLNSKLQELEKDIKSKKEETTKLKKRESLYQSRLQYSSKRVKLKEKDLPIFEKMIKNNEEESLKKTNSLDETINEILILQTKIKLQLDSLQSNKYLSSASLLDSATFNSQKDITFLQEVCKYDYKILKQLLEKKSNLEKELKDLENEKNDILIRQRDAEYSYNKHSKLVKTNKTTLANIKQAKKLTEKEIKELEESQKKIASLIIEAQKVNGTQSEAFKKILESNFELAKGLFTWPVEGEVVRRFTKKKQEGKYGLIESNPGIDIKAFNDIKVKSIARGKVIYADYFKNYGNVVIIQHSKEYCSLYAHLKDLYVHKGEIIDTMHSIGILDIYNGKGEYILHFEISKNGVPLDPLSWLKK